MYFTILVSLKYLNTRSCRRSSQMYGAGMPLYLRLPDDGGSAPKRLGFLETYVQFVILLCCFCC